MTKVLYVLVTTLAFIVVWTLPSCYSQSHETQTTTSSPSSSPAMTRLVFSQSGTGDSLIGSSIATTQAFHINSSQWQIKTTCEAFKSGPVALTATVFPKGKPISNNDFIAIASQNSPGTSINYAHSSGDFYLSITAMNIKKWTVEVYE